MKQLVIGALLSATIMVSSATAQKKEFREEIKIEISFETDDSNNLLLVQNINGSISVEGYNGNKVQIVVEKIVTAKSTEKLELGKKEISLETLSEGIEIIARVKGPCIRWEEDEGFRYGNCDCDRKKSPYDFTLNFTVKVPYDTSLDVTTINHGEVSVKNTKGKRLKAGNINGGIDLINITGQTEVNAINGEVTVSYASNPTAPSRYFALNGDINITYQKDLSAEIAFKSMNGELFTDFDIADQYAKTSKSKSGKDGKGKYKYESLKEMESFHCRCKHYP